MTVYDPTVTRLQLLRNGYYPIPLFHKKPNLKGWNGPAFENPSEDDVRSWAKKHKWHRSTGVQVREGLMPFDFDIQDEALMDEMLNKHLLDIAPDVYHGPLRTGKYPKLMAFARWVPSTDHPDMFQKWHSGKYIDGNGTSHCIEVFGGHRTALHKPSNFVALYGVHTYVDDLPWNAELVRYSWEGENDDPPAPTLADIPFDRLPTVTPEQTIELLTIFDAIAKKRGWTLVLPSNGDKNVKFKYDITAATRFDVEHGPPEPVSYVELCGMDDNNLRVSGSFIDGSTHRRDKCRVGYCYARNAVGVFDPEEFCWHLPKEAEPPTLDGAKPLDLGKLAGQASGELPKGSKRSDFYAHLPTHEYIYIPTRALWPAASINAVLDKIVVGQKAKKQKKADIEAGEPPEMVDVTIPPSLWLDRHRAVQQMGWAPGHPLIVEGRLATEGGWIDQADARTFNLYQPPPERSLDGNPDEAAPWVALVRKIYPDHADHIFTYLAHCLQFPGVKINHALVLVGAPRIGKDTLLEPLGYGLGEWNLKEVRPQDIVSTHNDFRLCLVLRISETHDLGDTTRYTFYNATKTLIAAPPAMVRINTKYVKQFYAPNVHCTIMTTNHPTDGVYLPVDDGRHYVAGTDFKMEDHAKDYLPEIWQWYHQGGFDHVIAWLYAYDLAGFDAKAPPRKTPEFYRLADAGRSAEVPELRDVIDVLGTPKAFTLTMLKAEAMNADHGLYQWLSDKRNARQVPHRMDECGFVPVRCNGPADGMWIVGGKRVTIYASVELSPAERYVAAERLSDPPKKGEVVPFSPSARR